MNVISTASAGLSAALDRTNRIAASVAAPPVANDASAGSTPDAGNLSVPDVKDLLDLETAKVAVEANAAVLRAGTRMSANLVDILA